MIFEILKMFGLVVLQNASFTLVSRARNSKSILYHALAAIGSNGIWLLVIRQVVTHFDSWPLMVTYLVGSVSGSIAMHYIAMKFFEKPKVIVQKPSVGRIVNFSEYGPIIVPAIITKVHNETCVDLQIFGSSNMLRTSVVQGDLNFQWNWPKIK